MASCARHQGLRARWYNAALGRFTQVDPFGGLLAAPGTQHPYAYAFNNPLNLVDPSGLGPGDVLRDLFSLPMRAWTTYWDEHYCLSLWDALKDIHTWDLVATYFLYAYIPFLAAEIAPWLLWPLTGAVEAAGLALLGVEGSALLVSAATLLAGGVALVGIAGLSLGAGGLAATGTAVLNLLVGENWYQGTGLAAFGAITALWAKAAPLPDTERPGYIIYAQLDEQGRPTEVIASVTRDMLGTGTEAVYTPEGFPGGLYDRGHLLGRNLGGSGEDPRNIASILSRVNRGAMQRCEVAVARAVRRGEVVQYVVRPIYQGTSMIPVGITLEARGSGGFQLLLTLLNRM